MSMFFQFRQTLSQFLIVLLCVSAIGVLQLPQLKRLSTRIQNASPQELEKEVDSEELRLNLLHKLPTFGFNNLIADWVFINFLIYFGDDPVRQYTGYDLSPEYFEIIVERDPRFLQAYLGLSTSISMYAGMPDKAVALMEKGLQAMSPKVPQKSYYVWRYKGTDELLFLGDTQAARRSFEKSAEWASTYSDAESQNVAAISLQTAQFLARNPKSKFAQIGAWTMVLTNAVDERTRKRAISQIEALGGKVVITPEGTVKVQLPEKD